MDPNQKDPNAQQPPIAPSAQPVQPPIAPVTGSQSPVSNYVPPAVNNEPMVGSFGEPQAAIKLNESPIGEGGSTPISKFWKIYLSTNLFLLAISILFPFSFLFYLSDQAKKGVSGTEFMALALIPVFLFLLVLAVINAIVIPIFLKRNKPKGKWLAVSMILFVPSILVVCVGVFAIIANVIAFKGLSQTRKTQTAELKAQAAATKPKEISVEEATALLKSCSIKGFYYTTQNGVDGGENAEASKTGVLVVNIDGAPYRIHVADRVAPQLVPVAREVQKTCNGGPQFWHDDHYEQFKDGKWYFMGEVANNLQSGKTKEEVVSFMQSCKADYFVGYTDIALVKDGTTKSWLNKAEQSTSGLEISEGAPKSYVFASKANTPVLQDAARQYRQSCYNTKKLYIAIDDWLETEYPIGKWTRIKQ